MLLLPPPLAPWVLHSLFNLTLFLPSTVVQPFWIHRIPKVTTVLHVMGHICEVLWSSGYLLLWYCCACLLGIATITMLMPCMSSVCCATVCQTLLSAFPSMPKHFFASLWRQILGVTCSYQFPECHWFWVNITVWPELCDSLLDNLCSVFSSEI